MRRPALKISEQTLQSAVIATARALGWRVAHFRPAKTEKGWRTPVEADGAGWPDLTLVRRERLLFAELKSASGSLDPEQTVWLRALQQTGAEVVVWDDRDWTSGHIEEVLR